MSMNESLGYVQQKVDEALGFFRNRRDFNRRMAFWFTLIPAAMSALSTVAVGSSEQLGVTWPLVVAMFASGLATVIGAWDSLFSNRKLWVVNNSAICDLDALRTDIEYRLTQSATPLTQAEVDEFFERYKKIQERAEKSWHAINAT